MAQLVSRAKTGKSDQIPLSWAHSCWSLLLPGPQRLLSAASRWARMLIQHSLVCPGRALQRLPGCLSPGWTGGRWGPGQWDGVWLSHGMGHSVTTGWGAGSPWDRAQEAYGMGHCMSTGMGYRMPRDRVQDAQGWGTTCSSSPWAPPAPTFHPNPSGLHLPSAGWHWDPLPFLLDPAEPCATASPIFWERVLGLSHLLGLGWG